MSVRVTARDDEWLRTHDEAQACLRYAATGARVRFWRPTPKDFTERTSDKTCSYSVELERLGAEPLVVLGAYALPCHAARLAANVRERLEQGAARAARGE